MSTAAEIFVNIALLLLLSALLLAFTVNAEFLPFLTEVHKWRSHLGVWVGGLLFFSKPKNLKFGTDLVSITS